MSKATKSTLKAVFIDFSRQQLTEVKEVESTRSRKEIWGLFFKEIPDYVSRRSAKITLVEQNGEYKYRLIKRKRPKQQFLILWCNWNECVPDTALIQFSAASAELKSIYKAAEKHFYLRTIARKAAAGVATIALSAYAGGAFDSSLMSDTNKQRGGYDEKKETTSFEFNGMRIEVPSSYTIGDVKQELVRQFKGAILKKIIVRDPQTSRDATDADFASFYNGRKMLVLNLQPGPSPTSLCDGIKIIFSLSDLADIDTESSIPLVLDNAQILKMEKQFAEKNIGVLPSKSCLSPKNATNHVFNCEKFKQIMKMYYRLAKSGMLDVLPQLLQSSFCKETYMIYTQPCNPPVQSNLSDLLYSLVVLKEVPDFNNLKFQRLSCGKIDISSSNEGKGLFDEEIGLHMKEDLRKYMKPHVWVYDYLARDKRVEDFLKEERYKNLTVTTAIIERIFGLIGGWATSVDGWPAGKKLEEMKKDTLEKVLAIFRKNEYTPAQFLIAENVKLITTSENDRFLIPFVKKRHPGVDENIAQLYDVLGYYPYNDAVEKPFAVFGTVKNASLNYYYLVCSVDDKLDQTWIGNDLFTFIQAAVKLMRNLKLTSEHKPIHVRLIRNNKNSLLPTSFAEEKLVSSETEMNVTITSGLVVEAPVLQVHLLTNRNGFFGKGALEDRNNLFMMNPCFHPEMLSNPLLAKRNNPPVSRLVAFWEAKLENKKRYDRLQEVAKIFNGYKLYKFNESLVNAWTPTPTLLYTPCEDKKLDCKEIIAKLATQRFLGLKDTVERDSGFRELGYFDQDDTLNAYKDFVYGVLCNKPDGKWVLLVRNIDNDGKREKQSNIIQSKAKQLHKDVTIVEVTNKYTLLPNDEHFLFSPFIITKMFDNIIAA